MRRTQEIGGSNPTLVGMPKAAGMAIICFSDYLVLLSKLSHSLCCLVYTIELDCRAVVCTPSALYL